MPSRRVQPSNTSVALSAQAQQAPTGTKPSPSLPTITRSTSPSGLSSFFSKPSKWFARNTAAPRPPLPESRRSSSSVNSQRKQTISGPTDPRPIEAGPEKEGKLGGGSGLASRSVVDLSLARSSTNLNSLDIPRQHNLGDLRSISRKGWSRSADNLTSIPSPSLSITTSFADEQKAKIEQYRSGNSPGTPQSTHQAYPFPTIAASPSTPVNSEPSFTIPQHVHSRSVSHTPNPVSNSRLAPPSPQQAFRKRSGDFERVREKSAGASSTSKGGAFSFAFGGASAAKPCPAPSAGVPSIVEPATSLSEDESKRASQIVHRAGFVNRLLTFSPESPHLSSSKNWKPFKLILKGSKLYFYKPPSDKSSAIKELFPSGLVTVLEDALEQEDSDTPETTRRRDRDEAKKKRAFWGRRTHPELIVADGRIVKGAFEAMVHELVFGTTFRVLDDCSSVDLKVEASPEWQLFASSVLLSLPHIADRVKFEAEFIRCASYLVTGAEETKQDVERARLNWLTAEYVNFHGQPANPVAWEAFRSDILPSFEPANAPSLPAPSASTKVIYLDSPDLGTFSPRPTDAYKMPTFSSAFGPLPGSLTSFPSSPARSVKVGSRGRIWHMLDQEGFTRDVFLRLDVDAAVQSLLRHHRSILESSSGSFLAKVILSDGPESQLTEFFGSDENPHWLTRLVVVQILGPGSNTSGSRGDDADERAARSSPTHTRSEVISKWAKIGEQCRLSGDECSWRVIMAALCSKPIARLEKAWKRVDTQCLSIIRSWVYGAQDGEKATVKEPRTTPWAGDARHKAAALLSRVYDAQSAEWSYAPMEDLKHIYDTSRSPFVACVTNLHMHDSVDEEDLARLKQLWYDSSAAPAPKNTLIDQYMSLSFAAESRRKGRFAPYYWTRQAGSQGIQSLIPLAFPEPLPTITLIDRSQILRTKKLSLENTPMTTDVHMSRILELKTTLESKGNLNGGSPSKPRLRGSGGLELGGTILPVFDGELLLLVQPGSESASRPVSTVDPDNNNSPSRTPSIRVKTAAARLERKTSKARRSSLPSISQRAVMPITESSTEPPLRVVVQAGTLDALVQLLVHGLEGVTVSVADDNGEMALRDGNTRSVKVDRGEFAGIWWNVFRSFVSPLVFFELLRKQYLGASMTRQSASPHDLHQGVRRRLDVIETMSEWISQGGGAQDALDDIELFASLKSFLSHSDQPSALPQDDELKKSLENLESARETLLGTFLSATMRPQINFSPVRGSVNGVTDRNYGTTPPSVDNANPLEFVNNLDALAVAAFRNVVQDDLFVTADLLEVQTADRTGWYLSREPLSASEEVHIQTMYTHISEVEPTPLVGELSSDSLYRLLPPGVRSLIRAHNILRKWAISKIVAPNLGLPVRQARMELYLQAIEVCRLRSSDSSMAHLNPVDRPCLRSFVEALLTSVVLSPESRLFYRAWQNVAATRGASADSLSSILSRPTIQELPSTDRLTVDPAWLLERMLEVVSLPDVLESTSVSPVNLVNFEKRRNLCNLILNSSSFTAPRASHQRREMDRCDFERLNSIEREASEIQLDFRAIRDDAHRESYAFGPQSTPNNKRNLRPFQRHVLAQQEKLKRDKNIRDRLVKEKRLEQQKHDRREEDINRAMETRKYAQAAHKQHRSKRSMSAFFRVMRPISTALSSDSIGSSTQKRNAAELDFTPTQQPALALSLVDARVAQFINNERSYTFQLDTEDGGHYLLQAASKAEMNKWITAIHSTVKSYAQRRLTYIDDSPKPQLSDHIHSRPKTASRDPVAVFGVDLTFLVSREAGGGEIPVGAVPRVLELCLSEIEARGLEEVGIYRVAGATTEVAALRESFNNGKLTIDDTTDIHAVGDCVKYWLRTLPEPLFPEVYYNDIIDATSIIDLDHRLSKIRDVVHSLPRAHYNVLKRLMEHLDRVADFEEKNHMTPGNIAVVFSPNLLRAPHNNFGVIMKNMGLTHVLTKALITHLHVIFGETEGDPENEDDEDEDGDVEGEPEIEEDVDTPIADPYDDGDALLLRGTNHTPPEIILSS